MAAVSHARCRCERKGFAKDLHGWSRKLTQAIGLEEVFKYLDKNQSTGAVLIPWYMAEVKRPDELWAPERRCSRCTTGEADNQKTKYTNDISGNACINIPIHVPDVVANSTMANASSSANISQLSSDANIIMPYLKAIVPPWPMCSSSSDGIKEEPLDLSVHQSTSVNENGLASHDAESVIRATGLLGKRKYTSDDMLHAIGEIKAGRLGVRKAANIYGIPRSTLRNKVQPTIAKVVGQLPTGCAEAKGKVRVECSSKPPSDSDTSCSPEVNHTSSPTSAEAQVKAEYNKGPGNPYMEATSAVKGYDHSTLSMLTALSMLPRDMPSHLGLLPYGLTHELAWLRAQQGLLGFSHPFLLHGGMPTYQASSSFENFLGMIGHNSTEGNNRIRSLNKLDQLRKRHNFGNDSNLDKARPEHTSLGALAKKLPDTTYKMLVRRLVAFYLRCKLQEVEMLFTGYPGRVAATCSTSSTSSLPDIDWNHIFTSKADSKAAALGAGTNKNCGKITTCTASVACHHHSTDFGNATENAPGNSSFVGMGVRRKTIRDHLEEKERADRQHLELKRHLRHTRPSGVPTSRSESDILGNMMQKVLSARLGQVLHAPSCTDSNQHIGTPQQAKRIRLDNRNLTPSKTDSLINGYTSGTDQIGVSGTPKALAEVKAKAEPRLFEPRSSVLHSSEMLSARDVHRRFAGMPDKQNDTDRASNVLLDLSLKLGAGASASELLRSLKQKVVANSAKSPNTS